MNERLLLDNKSKPARDVSNILYQEVKKHEANRHLIYIFDDDFRTAAQGWDLGQPSGPGPLDEKEWGLWTINYGHENPLERQNIIGEWIQSKENSEMLREKLMQIRSSKWMEMIPLRLQ